MNARDFDRRRFLKGGALAAFSLPFLRILPSSAAAAQYPKRLVFFCTPNGTVMDDWWNGTGCGYGRILDSLKPLQSKITLVRGVNMESAYKTPIPKDHWPDNNNMLIARQALGGPDDFSPAGISIDQQVAATVGKQTKFASLQLGNTTGSYCGIVSSLGAMQGIAPENNPLNMYNRLFADLSVTDANAAAKLRATHKSVLDMVGSELGDLKCQLGADDRVKFETHITSIRELERTLDQATAAGCKAPATKPTTSTKAFVDVGKAQLDNVAATLACDLTRVITLQWGQGASNIAFQWIGISGSHHGISHGSEGVTAGPDQRKEWLVSIEQWYAQQFTYLCQKLDAIPEGDGTVLDHTALVWCHEQSNGQTHSRKDMPYVIAGGCNGALKMGQCMNLGGVAHNNLLITLANAMDVPITSFGDPDFSKGPIATLMK